MTVLTYVHGEVSVGTEEVTLITSKNPFSNFLQSLALDVRLLQDVRRMFTRLKALHLVWVLFS